MWWPSCLYLTVRLQVLEASLSGSEAGVTSSLGKAGIHSLWGQARHGANNPKTPTEEGFAMKFWGFIPILQPHGKIIQRSSHLSAPVSKPWPSHIIGRPGAQRSCWSILLGSLRAQLSPAWPSLKTLIPTDCRLVSPVASLCGWWLAHTFWCYSGF